MTRGKVNRTTRAFAAFVSTAALTCALSVSAQDQERGRRGPEVGVPYLIPPGVVDLDEPQREKITTMRRELHDRLCSLTGELLLAQEELRTRLARRPRSNESLAEASRRISDIRSRILEARSEAQERATAMLQPQQREVLAKWQEGRRGGRGELDAVPYTVLPSIESDEPDIENLEDPELNPRY